jgi:hypothetical protein
MTGVSSLKIIVHPKKDFSKWNMCCLCVCPAVKSGVVKLYF